MKTRREPHNTRPAFWRAFLLGREVGKTLNDPTTTRASSAPVFRFSFVTLLPPLPPPRIATLSFRLSIDPSIHQSSPEKQFSLASHNLCIDTLRARDQKLTLSLLQLARILQLFALQHSNYKRENTYNKE